MKCPKCKAHNSLELKRHTLVAVPYDEVHCMLCGFIATRPVLVVTEVRLEGERLAGGKLMVPCRVRGCKCKVWHERNELGLCLVHRDAVRAWTARCRRAGKELPSPFAEMDDGSWVPTQQYHRYRRQAPAPPTAEAGK